MNLQQTSSSASALGVPGDSWQQGCGAVLGGCWHREGSAVLRGTLVQGVETAGRSQQEQRLEADVRVQKRQWQQAADTKQRIGCLETAGEAWQRTKVTTAAQLMVAAAEVPMEEQEAGAKEGGGQLLLGAAAWV